MNSTAPAAPFVPPFPYPQRRRNALVLVWLTMATDADLSVALGALTDERLGKIASFAEATIQGRLANRHAAGHCGGCGFCQIEVA